MDEVVLGVHFSAGADGFFTADGNVAVVVDGVPVFAVAQERVTRQKYAGGFLDAARYALDSIGASVSDIDAVAVSMFGRSDVVGSSEHEEALRSVENALGSGPDYHAVPSHHLAHALSAVAQCPFERALVAVIDNEGSLIGERTAAELWRHRLERTSYYLLDGDSLTLVARDHDGPGEVGYGKAYSKVTRYVGFRSYQESGKTMALAAFGDAGRFGGLRLFLEDGAGQPRTVMPNSEDGLDDLAGFFRRAGIDLPPPRRPGEWMDPAHIDLAAWCQRELEESVCRRVLQLSAAHGTSALCGAGGVFLNSVMNRRLQDRLDTGDVFVPPSPGDQGMALGAAAWWLWRSTGRIPRWSPYPYLGGRFGDTATKEAVANAPDLVWQEVSDPVDDAVREVAAGHVVGWFQGASEYGPRALGNRSILADPSGPWTREVLNNLVKHREWFRPYAPVGVEEHASDVFELRSAVPFMMHVAPVRRAAVNRVPAGVHVDGSARLQTVSPAQNPFFHRLVSRFTARTGSPSILNTSLNVDGMPIVETPADATECLRRAPGMRALFIGSIKVTRARPGGGEATDGR